MGKYLISTSATLRPVKVRETTMAKLIGRLERLIYEAKEELDSYNKNEYLVTAGKIRKNKIRLSYIKNEGSSSRLKIRLRG